jgi:hypothetical protein
MSKQPRQTDSNPKATYDTQRLVVWGERRKEPDWDTFIAALLAHSLAEVERKNGKKHG